MRLEVGEVAREVAARQDAAVHGGMECDDAMAEQLAEPGQALDARHSDAVLLEVRRRASARDDLPALLGEPARELGHPVLVVDRDQRAQSSLTTVGSSLCSTAWIRSSSVSRGSTGTGSWRITGPVSMPSST